jgi:3-phenylpropionate/trans-cinnamate dioxygenase ferredoxin subunit
VAAKHVVGPASEFTDGEKRIVEIGGRSVGIIYSNDEFFAVRNVCPHASAPVCLGELTDTALPSEPGVFRYGMKGYVLRCPWHNWEFDLRTGEALFGTDDRSLTTYPVSIEDGNVVVELKRRRAEVMAVAPVDAT